MKPAYPEELAKAMLAGFWKWADETGVDGSLAHRPKNLPGGKTHIKFLDAQVNYLWLVYQAGYRDCQIAGLRDSEAEQEAKA